jgi:hypothetical protein
MMKIITKKERESIMYGKFFLVSTQALIATGLSISICSTTQLQAAQDLVQGMEYQLTVKAVRAKEILDQTPVPPSRIAADADASKIAQELAGRGGARIAMATDSLGWESAALARKEGETYGHVLSKGEVVEMRRKRQAAEISSRDADEALSKYRASKESHPRSSSPLLSAADRTKAELEGKKEDTR